MSRPLDYRSAEPGSSRRVRPLIKLLAVLWSLVLVTAAVGVACSSDTNPYQMASAMALALVLMLALIVTLAWAVDAAVGAITRRRRMPDDN